MTDCEFLPSWNLVKTHNPFVICLLSGLLWVSVGLPCPLLKGSMEPPCQSGIADYANATTWQ